MVLRRKKKATMRAPLSETKDSNSSAPPSASRTDMGLGVSISFLHDLIGILKVDFPEDQETIVKGENMSWNTITTTGLCTGFVKPKTLEALKRTPKKLEKGSASYAEMILQYTDNTVPNHWNPEERVPAVGPPTQFVSHAWRYVFHDLVNAVSDFVTSEDPNLGGTGTLNHKEEFFWIDNFAVDENWSSGHSQDWWKSTFQEAIKNIGSTVLILQPWHRPVPLTRSWCLWEIFSARVKGVPLHIRMSSQEREEFLQALITDFDRVLRCLSDINVKDAEAGNPKDREMILKHVSEGVGFEDLNLLVKDGMRDWLAKEGQEAIRQMGRDLELIEDEEEKKRKRKEKLQLQVRVGDLLTGLDKLVDGCEMLETALTELGEVTGQSWQESEEPITVDCVGSLGRAKFKEMNLEKARELLDRAFVAGSAIRDSVEDFHHEYFSTALDYANLLKKLGEDGEAEKKFKCVSEGCADSDQINKNDPLPLQAASDYARFLRLKGETMSAFELLDDVISRAKVAFGEHGTSNVVFLNCKLNQATILKNLAKLEMKNKSGAPVATHPNLPKGGKKKQMKALQLFSEVYKERKQILGRYHRDTIKAHHDMAKMQLEMKKIDLAKQRCEKVLKGLQERDEPEEELEVEVKLTLAKIACEQGKYNTAIEILTTVKDAYTDRLGEMHVKTLNSLGELGFVYTQAKQRTQGLDMMRVACDGLKTKLNGDHAWVSKIEGRILSGGKTKAKAGKKGKKSSDEGVPRVVVFDCGTNESKAILCSHIDGSPVIAEVGEKLEAMSTFLQERKTLFATTMADRALEAEVDDLYIGMSAWYRKLSPELQKDAMEVIDQASEECTVATIKKMELPQAKEAEYEARAVQYAAKHSGLSHPECVVGCGGGSLQMSLIDHQDKIDVHGLEEGFREGQLALMKKGISVVPKLEEQWDKLTTDFVKKERLHVKKCDVVAISSCYHGSVAAGIGEEPILAQVAVKRFAECLATLIADAPQEGPLEKRLAINISNIIIQIRVFSTLIHSSSKVAFRRNWMVDKLIFRTTWTMGWYLSVYGSKLEKLRNKKIEDSKPPPSARASARGVRSPSVRPPPVKNAKKTQRTSLGKIMGRK